MGDPLLKIDFQLLHVRALLWLGRFAEARKIVDGAEDLAATEPMRHSEVFGWNSYLVLLLFRGDFSSVMGRPREGALCHERGISLARQFEDTEDLGLLYADAAATTWWFLGDVEQRLDHARGAVGIAEKLGALQSLTHSYLNLGAALVMAREWHDAIAALQKMRGIAREARSSLEWECPALAYLAEAYRGLDDRERAIKAARESVALAEQFRLKVFETHAHYYLARVLLHFEGADARAEVESELSRLETLVDWMGARSWQPFVHEERARLARVLKDEATCELELREAHRLFVEMDARGHAERIAQELGS